jgi:hypothetical protein
MVFDEKSTLRLEISPRDAIEGVSWLQNEVHNFGEKGRHTR